MPIDVSILSQYKPPQPEPLLNTLAQFENIRGAQQQQQMNALQLQRAERELAEQDFINQLYSQPGVLSPTGEVDYGAARGFASQRGMGGLVPKLSAQEQAQRKAQAEAAQAQVKLQTDQAKLIVDKTKMYSDMLSRIQTPEAAEAWIAGLYQDKEVGQFLTQMGATQDRALQELRAARAANDFAGWRGRSMQGAETIATRLTDQSDIQNAWQEAQSIAAPTTDVEAGTGREVTTDTESLYRAFVDSLQIRGRGDLAKAWFDQHLKTAMLPYASLPPGAAELEALRRHPELQAMKERLAELSASRQTVNVSTGEKASAKYAEAFGTEVAKQDIKLKEAAETAPKLAADAERILSALKQKDLITGFGADFRLSAAKALNLVGADNAKTISNTEVLRSSLATQTLNAIKESNLGTGQGFTNQDREFLQDSKSGRIEFDRNSLERLADLAYRAAQESAKRWNARRAKMPAEARDAMGLDEDVVVKPMRRQDMGAPAPLSEGRTQEGYPVKAPNGKTYYFPTQRAADEYKRMIEKGQ